jgi:hypothetical protein
MSIEIVREVAVIAAFVGFIGFLLVALTPRGFTHFEEAVRLPGAKAFGNGEEGR